MPRRATIFVEFQMIKVPLLYPSQPRLSPGPESEGPGNYFLPELQVLFPPRSF